MARSSGPEGMSLDRLKALEGLADVETQLHEAQQLCNHAARADMILRWLLAKLTSSKDARNILSSWELFASAVRLLSKQKVAILLGTNGFMDLLRMTCAETNLRSDSLIGLANLLVLLLELAQHPDGAAVKSVFVIGSETAASLCGNWLQHVYDGCVDVNKNINHSAFQCLLSPPLQIWALRKRTRSDDDLFNTNCMLPALLLLALPTSTEPRSSTKRKRGQESSRYQTLRSLESLIAIHTVSRARTAFFDNQSNSAHQPYKQTPVPSQPEIRERLGPLKVAILHRLYPHVLATVPLVLDIAIRSVSMPTPKHRFGERPWIETFVTALRSCIPHERKEDDSEMLTEILKVLHFHGLSLSPQLLSTIIKQQPFLRDQEGPMNWTLVAEVVKMESNVFTDQVLTEAIFRAVAAQQDCQTCDGAIGNWQSVSLKNEVIVPIMKAFEKSRKAEEFVGVWRKQLLLLNSSSDYSIWTDIARIFGDDLESTMSYEQIVSIFDSLSQPLYDWASSANIIYNTDWSASTASFTQLYAIVSGIRSQDALGKLHTKLDIFVRNLFALKILQRDEVPTFALHELFKLLTRSFELWFPFWAAQQGERRIVAKLGASLLDSSVVRIAHEICAASDSQLAHAAQEIIATMCDRFQHYKGNEECLRLVTELVRGLSALPVIRARDIFIRYPALLQPMDSARCQELFAENFAVSPLDIMDVQSVRTMAEALVSKDHFSLETAILEVSNELRNPGNSDSSVKEFNLLQFLLSIERNALTQVQHTTLLDTLLRLHQAPSGEIVTQQTQQRLSLVLFLLPGAQRDALLLNDPSSVWCLAAAIDAKGTAPRTGTSLSESLENMQLLEEITRIILEFWLAGKDHGKDRDILAQFSKYVKEYIKKTVKIGMLSDRPGSLAVTKTAIVLLSKNISSEHPVSLIHQDYKTIKLFMESLVKEAESSLSSSDVVRGPQSFGTLDSVLNVLAAMPQSVWSDKSLEGIRERVLALARRLFEYEETTCPGASKCKVNCFRLIHTYGGDSLENVIHLLEVALESKLDAASHDQLLEVYADAAQATDEAGKLSALNYLSSKLAHSPAALLLYREVVFTIDSDQLERTDPLSDESKPLSGPKVIQPILHAALDGKSLVSRRTALQSIALLTKKQPYLLNQYGVEQTIATLHQLLVTYPYITAIYTDTCDILAALFAAQRARLQGRFHLLVAIFQIFISALFRHHQDTAHSEISIQHARALARLLEFFCNPPQTRRRGKTSELVDEARKAQAHAGQYAHYILHHYCSKILDGPLVDGVREALMPGLWAMIEAVEVNNMDGIKSLSAAMNNSERAVLRSVYDDWKRFGKWEGS